MSEQVLWGIDLGGTKIEGVVLRSAENPEVLCRKRIPTEGSKGYEHVLGQIKSLIDDISEETGLQPTKLGIGTPGSIDKTTGQLKGSNSQHLNGQPVNTDLQNLLSIPVIIENDANCFALAETNMGVVQKVDPEADVVFGVIMGTGVGGGLVINKKLIAGKHGIAGEWGHNFLHDSGGLCYCGRTGCVETVISGPALEKFYAGLSGDKKKLSEIAVMANEGNEIAIATMNRLTDHFARAISQVINIIDPDVIVIGGGVGNLACLYKEGVDKLLPHVFHPHFKGQIVAPALGDSAGVFGAAFLSVD